MANYSMYDDSVKCKIEIDLLSFDFNYMIDDIINEIHEALQSIDFTLNKYSWDNKRAYENTHQNMIKDARSSKAQLLMTLRRLEKKLDNK